MEILALSCSCCSSLCLPSISSATRLRYSDDSVFNLNSHLRAEISLISSHVVLFQRILSPTTHHCWQLTNFIVSPNFFFCLQFSSFVSPTSWWNHHWSLTTMFCYFIFITKMACWNARDLQPNLLSRCFHWTLVDFQDLICSRLDEIDTITKLMFHQSICIQTGEGKSGKVFDFSCISVIIGWY